MILGLRATEWVENQKVFRWTNAEFGLDMEFVTNKDI